MSKNLAAKSNFSARRNIRIAGLNGDAQRAGARAGMVIIAADGRRIQPRLSIDVHAGGKRCAPGAAAWGTGTYVRKIHQDGFRRDVVRAVSWERCGTAI